MSTAIASVSVSQKFAVPVVNPNLRQTETYFQLVCSLKQLTETVDNVFGAITARVNKEKERLQGVVTRIDGVNAKVNAIRGSTKATQVFSPAKYPAPDTLEQSEHLFAKAPPISFESKYKVKLQDNPHNPPAYVEDPVVKFAGMSSIDDVVEGEKEGLGRLPERLPSISGLLLFNTQENLYKKYINLDPLLGEDKPTRKETTDKEEIYAAPTSLIEGDTLPTPDGLKIGYVPVLDEKNVPTLDNLPNTLPDLPMVATNISYAPAGTTLTSIAPTALVPELPNADGSTDAALPPADSAPTVDVPPVESGSGAPSAPPLPPSGAESTPTPPPPPPPSADAPAPPPPPPAAAGPPPPPPAGVPKAVAAPDSGRGGLLAQIRANNKAKLKSVKKRIKKDKKKAKPAGGGGLMGDLMSALMLRRRGISKGGAGKKTKKSKKGGDDEDDDIKPPVLDEDSGDDIEPANDLFDDDSENEGEWDA